ncbi:MAG: DUF4339 domain-containing protein [Planctomycetota bacterium]
MSGQRFYYLDDQGRQRGPVSPGEMHDLCTLGRVTPDRFVWTDGWDEWQPASQMPELFEAQPEPEAVGVATALAEPPASGTGGSASSPGGSGAGPAFELRPEFRSQLRPQAQAEPEPQKLNAFGVPIEEDGEDLTLRHLTPPTEAGALGGNAEAMGYLAPRAPFGGPPDFDPEYRPGSFVGLLLWWLGFGLVGAGAYAAGFTIVFMEAFNTAGMQVSPEQQAAQFEQALIRGGVTMLAGVPFVLLAAITWWRLLYRAWRQIQDGFAQTTPGKAVGFLFIPFFNLYWHFVAFYGLSKDMRAYAQRHGVSGVGVSPGVGLALAITNVGAFVGGFLGPFALVVPIVLLVTFLIFTWQIAAGSRAIAAHQQGIALG